MTICMATISPGNANLYYEVSFGGISYIIRVCCVQFFCQFNNQLLIGERVKLDAIGNNQSRLKAYIECAPRFLRGVLLEGSVSSSINYH